VIKLPVSLNEDTAIVDADGNVVALMCWLGDLDHVRAQAERGKFICSVLNAVVSNGDGKSGQVEDVVEVKEKKSFNRGDAMREYWRKRREAQATA